MFRGTERPSIVVGVSGSPASRTALVWAAEQALRLRAPLTAVHVWEPSARLRAPYAPAAAIRTAAEDRARAQRLLDAAVSSAVPPDAAIEVRAVLCEGRAAVSLLRYAEGALLLALGQGLSTGGGRAILGPVIRDCVGRAPCPVVTVPYTASAASPSPAPRNSPPVHV